MNKSLRLNQAEHEKMTRQQSSRFIQGVVFKRCEFPLEKAFNSSFIKQKLIHDETSDVNDEYEI